MGDANVRSIQALSDLRSDFARFASESRTALQQMEMEIQRTQEWIAERQRHWEGKVRRCEEAVRRAQAQVDRCRALARRDKEDRPSCGGPEAALYRAQARLQEAESQLANVKRWSQTLTQAKATYQRQAQRMKTFSEKEVVEAQAFLVQAASLLAEYATGGGGIGNSRPALFERWTASNFFEEDTGQNQQQRITIPVHLNQHLAEVDDDGIGLDKTRTSDHYWLKDDSLWDMKLYSEKSKIDHRQLADYQLMEKAGYVIDNEGNERKVTSVNYLFSSRAAAENNRTDLHSMANAWYVDWHSDGTWEVCLLEDQP